MKNLTRHLAAALMATTLFGCLPSSPSGDPCPIGDGRTFGSSVAFDASTIREVRDPSTPACPGQIKILLVGDSTGRGLANGIASVRNPWIALWDRTTLGCSVGGEQCADWRGPWTSALKSVRPHAVVISTSIIDDFKGVADPAFLSPEGHRHRVAQLSSVVTTMQATGATVFVTSPPNAIAPTANFYCGGTAVNSLCDPRWSDQWRTTVAETAARTKAQILDVNAWNAARDRGLKDRPDGLHFSGPALQDAARWVIDEVAKRTPR